MAEQPLAPSPASGPGAVRGKSRRLIIILLVVAAIATLAFLLLRPRYQVELSADTEPVAGQSIPVTLLVSNAGSWGGTFDERVYVDGSEWKALRFKVAGGEQLPVDVELPANLPAGDHVMQVGDSELRLHLLRPAAFDVTSIDANTNLVVSGGSVGVTASISNSGDVGDDYEAVLRVDGRRVATQEVFVDGDDSATAQFSVKLSGDQRHKITVGNRSARVRSVPVTRLSNGHIIKWSGGRGHGRLIAKGGDHDSVVMLTSTDSSRRPLIAIYVRARSTATISGVPNNSYYIYYCLGNNWAPSLKRFLAIDERGRFRKKAHYTTEYGASYIRYSIITIGLTPSSSPHAAPVDRIPENEFPALAQSSDSAI